MTERWQRELKHLRKADPTDDVWTRAQRGPSGGGDPLPPRRQRIVAGVVAMSVFLTAGAFGWNALREHPGSDTAGTGSTAAIRYTVPGPAEPVIARLEVHGAASATPGPWMHLSYGSEEEDVPAQEQEDWSGPYAPTDDPLYGFAAKIPLGSTMRFEGDASSVTAETKNEIHGAEDVYAPLEITDGSADLPGPGTYLLHVVGAWDGTGDWPAGTAGFAVLIRVYDDITLENGAPPPTATLSLGDVTADAVVTSYKWNGLWTFANPAATDPSGAWPPKVNSFTQVPQGTSVTVDGPDVGAPPQLDLWDPTFEHHIWGETANWTGDPPFGMAPGRYVLVLEVTSGDKGPSAILRYAFGVDIVASEEPPPSPDPAAGIPDVLHVTCTPDSATVDTTQVRPQSDGLHVVMDASAEVANAEIDTGTTPETYFGVGLDPNEDGSRGIPIAPGSWFVGCSTRGDNVPIDAFGTSRAPAFTIVDPEGVYVPVDLACDAPTTRTYGATGSDVTADSIASVPGILPTDSVEPAGYPDGPGFKSGPMLTVLRDGTAVARIHLPFEANGSWTVSVDACPGSGVGPDSAPGAAGPVPDVAMARCAANGSTEMLNPIVNAQADGMHLRVDNRAGSPAIIVASAWDRAHPYQLAIPTDPNEEIVVPAHPGPVVLDCRSAIGDGIDDPFLSHSADDLHLQDPEGFFVPDGLDCDNADQVPIVPPEVVNVPSGEAFIRQLSEVLDSDIVERAGYLEGRGDAGPWRIVRDGQIIAKVDYGSLEGVTCRGSGITGA
jgi:hypothetical protein